MQLQLIVSDSVKEYFDDWRRLWLQSQEYPFLHPAWHLAYVQSQGHGIAAFIVLVRLEGALAGVLPMRRDPDGVLRFLTAPRSDYEDALVAEDYRSEVVSLLADFLVRERFELREVPGSTEMARALHERRVSSYISASCPGIRLTPEIVHDVINRKSLKRHERKLLRRGPISLEVIPHEATGPALRGLIGQHVARWITAGKDSLFLDRANREFYARLVQRQDFSEFGVFHVLKAGEVEAGYHIGLVGASTFLWYKPTFNLNIDSDGPGEVLFKLLVEQAWSTGKSYFDFSRGSEAFKLRFANEMRQNLCFAWRVPWSSRSRQLARRALGKVSRYAVSGLEKLQGINLPWKRQARLPLSEPDACPQTPDGFSALLAPVDLTVLAAFSLESGQYITQQRMKSAIARRKRGDRIFVVRRCNQEGPVHIAWFRVLDVSGTTPGRAVEIFDSWTAPAYRASGIADWGLRYLAWEARRLGLPAYAVSGRVDEPSSAEKSGGLRKTGYPVHQKNSDH